MVRTETETELLSAEQGSRNEEIRAEAKDVRDAQLEAGGWNGKTQEGEEYANFLEKEACLEMETLRLAKVMNEGWQQIKQERKCDGCGLAFPVETLAEIYFHNLETQYWFHSEKELLLWANSRLRLATDDDEDSDEDSEQEEIDEEEKLKTMEKEIGREAVVKLLMEK